MKLYIILLLLSFQFLVYSQKDPIKFGKIDIADLQMTKYDMDTSASAVVLCDYGYMDFTNSTFKRTIRIKILKKEGLDYANQILYGDEKSMIRGITYNLANNEIIETKLSLNSIYKERVYGDYYRLRIAMPKVIAGSVIDLEQTYYGYPRQWNFQNFIPVKWSELRIPDSSTPVRKYYSGFESLSISENVRWVAKDMPAFKTEPLISSANNYITKFDLLFFNRTDDWDKVASDLDEDEYFGVQLNASFYLNSLTNQIKENYKTDFARMKAAYEEIKKIKWNGYEGVFTTYGVLQKPFSEKVGNSADINLILINLLRKLDIKCDPVVLSTRENGEIHSWSPNIFKLNYVIGLARLKDKEYLLDATDDLLPVGLLPERCLNGEGRIFLETTLSKMIITPDKKESGIYNYDLKITTDNSIKGSYESEIKDYAAFNFRKYYKTFNDQSAYIEDVEKNNPGLRIDSVEISNLDSIYNPLKEKYSLELNNHFLKLDSTLLIYPMIHHRVFENPFKVEERKYPIDYAICTDKMYFINIKIPEGYTMKEIPKPALIELPGKTASALYQITCFNNEVKLYYRFCINKPVFNLDEYLLLKEFYNQIIKKHSEPLVLIKI